MSLETQAKIIHTVKKAGRKIIDSFEIRCWRRARWIPWTAGKANECILEQIKPELPLEAKMIQLRLSYFGHIMRRQDSSEKTTMLGKLEGSMKRVKTSIKWIDFIKEAIGMSLQELSRAVEDRTL